MIELTTEPESSDGVQAPEREAAPRAPDANTPCRAEIHIDQAPDSRALLALLALATVGVLFGRWFILQAPDAARLAKDNTAALQIWAALVGGLCGYGLTVGVVTTRWLSQLLSAFQSKASLKSAAGWVLSTFLILLMTSWIDYEIPFGMVAGHSVQPFSFQITAITVAAIVIAVPGLVGFLAIRSLAWDNCQWEKESPLCQVLLVTWLRRQLRRLLATFGLALTLLVVTTAARRQVVLAFYQNSTYSQESVLLYGLVFAAVLALFHLTATSAIDGRCDRLLATYAPIPDPVAQDLSTQLNRRQDLASILGMGKSWQDSFQNGVIILAPLITALIGVSLPK